MVVVRSGAGPGSGAADLCSGAGSGFGSESVGLLRRAFLDSRVSPRTSDGMVATGSEFVNVRMVSPRGSMGIPY